MTQYNFKPGTLVKVIKVGPKEGSLQDILSGNPYHTLPLNTTVEIKDIIKPESPVSGQPIMYKVGIPGEIGEHILGESQLGHLLS